MKKQSLTTTVHRIDLIDGKYATIAKHILLNPNLRDSSKTLLNLSLNNVESWELRLCYYQKLLEWSNDKMTGAVANLIQEGYLKMKKHPMGKNKGFYYTYVISEFGNLNPNKETVDMKDVKASLKDDQVETEEQCKDSIQQESNPEPEVKPIQPETETVIASEPQPEENKKFIYDEMFLDKVFAILQEEVKYVKHEDFIIKVGTYYRNQIETGKLVPDNFNETAVRNLLRERIEKLNQPIISEFTQWIDLENDRGTKDQRANIKAKAIVYFTEQLNKGVKITKYDVGVKILKLKSSVIDAHRTYDSRYQD